MISAKNRDWKALLRAEFVNGRTPFDWCFLALGLLVQVVVYCWDPQSALAFVSALAGICSVILCSQRKITTFLFGFVQVITYFILAWQQHLYAESVQNIFYFVTMVVGVYTWLRRYKVDDQQAASLTTRHLTLPVWIVSLVAIVALSVLTGWLLQTYTSDPQPYLDAFTTIPAVYAQILMILSYREQWVFWFLIDIGLTVLWIRAGNWCLVAQHLFWCINCVYGFVRWS